PSVSNTSLTPIEGKKCQLTGVLFDGMCLKNVCRGWDQHSYDVPFGKAQDTTITCVDFVPPSGAVWAGGSYPVKTNDGTEPQEKGFVVKLAGGLGMTKPTDLATPVKDLHRRVAVGQNGNFYYFDGNNWDNSQLVLGKPGDTDYNAVWGAETGTGQELFYLTIGSTLSNGVGALRCLKRFWGIECIKQNGFVPGLAIGPVFGVLDSAGNIEGIWAGGRGLLNNIYYNDGSWNMWQPAPPKGCEDHLVSPCYFPTGEYTRMYATRGDDVWMVGTNGMIIHFDGVDWKKVENIFASQASYNFDAVFASLADNLVTIVGHRRNLNTTTVSVLNYDSALKRWSGPIVIEQMADTIGNLRIYDMGGSGYSDLWMVGTKPVLSGNIGQKQGWILKLQ
ncbi:MAG: hypothetical protein V1754_07640, partial [Pseudomonadota bacterium]